MSLNTQQRHLPVALRKESVDRNDSSELNSSWISSSLSARRAWIEIEVENGFAGVLFVALRKESVDRNLDTRQHDAECLRSLSARRAWIEMCPGRI